MLKRLGCGNWRRLCRGWGESSGNLTRQQRCIAARRRFAIGLIAACAHPSCVNSIFDVELSRCRCCWIVSKASLAITGPTSVAAGAGNSCECGDVRRPGAHQFKAEPVYISGRAKERKPHLSLARSMPLSNGFRRSQNFACQTPQVRQAPRQASDALVMSFITERSIIPQHPSHHGDDAAFANSLPRQTRYLVKNPLDALRSPDRQALVSHYLGGLDEFPPLHDFITN